MKRKPTRKKAAKKAQRKAPCRGCVELRLAMADFVESRLREMKELEAKYTAKYTEAIGDVKGDYEHESAGLRAECKRLQEQLARSKEVQENLKQRVAKLMENPLESISAAMAEVRDAQRIANEETRAALKAWNDKFDGFRQELAGPVLTRILVATRGHLQTLGARGGTRIPRFPTEALNGMEELPE